MLRYRFKWNRNYGFELFYGKEGRLVVGLWTYDWDFRDSYIWRRTKITRELEREIDYSEYPRVYFDWIIGDMIREYENHDKYRKGEN